MAYEFRLVFRANLDVMWFVCDYVMVKDQFYRVSDCPRSNTVLWDGKISSRMTNGGVPKFPHTLVLVHGMVRFSLE